MATQDHVPYYRTKDSDTLATMLANLEAQETVFNAQSQGGTSMQRDLRRLDDKKNAIAFVLAERGASVEPQRALNDQSFGVTDFSNI